MAALPLKVEQSNLSKSIDAEDVRLTLDKILNSRYFAQAYKKKKFLSLISEFYLNGKAGDLNEYVLAYDVFGRDKTYNPSADPIVRVVAHEIRKKLETYYDKEGANDHIRMDLPPGSYQPVFQRRAIKTDTENQGTPSIKSSQPAINKILIAAISVLSILVIWLSYSNITMRNGGGNSLRSSNNRSVSILWQGFLSDSVPTIIVLSNPLVPRLSHSNESLPKSSEFVPIPNDTANFLRKRILTDSRTLSLGDPESTPDTQIPKLILSNVEYTGLGEAIGLHYITDFLRSINKDMTIKQSRTLSAEDLKNKNVIMLGGSWSNEWSGKLPDNEPFVYSIHATIYNRKPQSNELKEYAPEFDKQTGELLTDYALISVKPNVTKSNKILVLSGIHSQGTEAAVEFITDKHYVEQLNKVLKNASSHFQLLLKVGVENGIPTTITPLILRNLP